tara:strand:- start:1200 stop:1922 length:723 start_codon:yes stop_codon:yes gene_type:complete
MELITNELVNLSIKQRSLEDRNYLINRLSRNNLNNYDITNNYIGILPYYSLTNPINNYKKNFFINISNFLLDYKNNLIFTKIRNKTKEENTLKYEKTIIAHIKLYVSEIFNIKITKNENVIKILNIENQRIQIYLINIEKHIDKLENLSINKKLSLDELNLNKDYTNFKKVKIIDYYTKWEGLEKDKKVNFKSKKFKKKLYSNIVKLPYNKETLQKFFVLKICNNIKIKFKIKLFYNKLL